MRTTQSRVARIALWSISVILLGVAVMAGVSALVICRIDLGDSLREVRRIKGPSGALDAVLVRESGGGATGEIALAAYVVPQSAQVSKDSGLVIVATRGTDGESPDLIVSWPSAHELLVIVKNGWVRKSAPNVIVHGETVQVKVH